MGQQPHVIRWGAREAVRPWRAGHYLPAALLTRVARPPRRSALLAQLRMAYPAGLLPPQL